MNNSEVAVWLGTNALLCLTIFASIAVICNLEDSRLAYRNGYATTSNNAPVCYGPACEVCK